MLAWLTKYAKLITTTVGAVLILLNEVLPVVPAGAQQWVTGAIAVLTIVARDVAEIVGGTSDVKPTPPTPAAPAA